MIKRSLFGAFKSLVEPLRPRLVPGVIVIGAQKAGTSALFAMLEKHPKIIAPGVKEIGFFNDDAEYAKGLAHYLGQFPLRPLRGSGFCSLDATPAYLASPRAPERIREHFPKVPLVAVIRDPVRRAFSDWNMFHQFEDHPKYRHLYDPRGFEEAMEQELRDGVEKAPYLRRGDHAPQLRRYLLAFPKEQVLVFPYPELKRTPDRVVQRILEAMGLDPKAMPRTLERVKANVRPYRARMSPEIRERLEAHFAPKLEELWDVLGLRLDLSEERQ